MTIYEIIKQLSSTTKKNEKIRILTEHKDNEDLKRFFYLSLNPNINYWQKKIPVVNNRQKDTTDNLKQGMDRLSALSDRVVTGNDAIEALKGILESLSFEDRDVIKRIVLKDPSCGVDTTVNKIWPNLVPEWPVMLCEPFEQKYMDKMVWPAIVQRKEDGMRFNAVVKDGEVEFRSRKGKLLFLGEKISNDFRKMANGEDWIFDGELLVVKAENPLSLIDCSSDEWQLEDRATGNGILRKAGVGTISDEESDRVRAIVWDEIPYDDFFKKSYNVKYIVRMLDLQERLLKIDSGNVKLVETTSVNNFDEANTIFENYLKSGHEGVIVKNPNGPWEDKRVQHQIKLKAEKECDLVIVDWQEGREDTKYIGQCGGLLMESSDGKIKVTVGGGPAFTDKFRKEVTREVFDKQYVGKIGAVIYNARITKKNSDVDSLFLARLVEIRDDKTEADSEKTIK